MNATLYIHIGTHKTGTSAIQDFFSLNRKRLAKKGILYPQKSRRDYVDCVDGAYVVPEKKFKNYARLVRLGLKKNNNVVLSSETFSLIRDVSAMKTALGDAHVVIVCYLRRQDGVLQSLYNQSIKNEGCCCDISDYTPSTTLDYYELLGHWAAAFGKDNLVVRPYERHQFKDNNLIADFLDIVGLEFTSDYAQLKKNANPRLPAEAMDYMRLLNSLLKDKKKSKIIIKRLIPYCLESFKDSTESLYFNHSLLSPEQKRAVIDRYESSNRRVAREYLGREDERLFFESATEENPPISPRPVLSDEIISAITNSLCQSRTIKKILVRAVGQDLSSADDYTRKAHTQISGAIRRL